MIHAKPREVSNEPPAPHWTLYEDGSVVGITRSEKVMRAVASHNTILAALEDCYAEMVRNGWDSEKELRERSRLAIATARGDVK